MIHFKYVWFIVYQLYINKAVCFDFWTVMDPHSSSFFSVQTSQQLEALKNLENENISNSKDKGRRVTTPKPTTQRVKFYHLHIYIDI